MIILAQDDYDVGSYTSSPITVPTNPAPANSTFTVAGLMSAPDAENANITGTLLIEATYNGTTWVQAASTTWMGGTKNGNPTYPGQPWGFSPTNPPLAIRVVLGLNQLTNIGLSATFS